MKKSIRVKSDKRIEFLNWFMENPIRSETDFSEYDDDIYFWLKDHWNEIKKFFP